MRSRRPVVTATAAVVIFGIAVLVLLFRNSGSFLMVDNRQKSDALVITQGDSLDHSYWMGMSLLKSGYGRELLLDARSNRVFFGRTQADWARDFIAKTAAAYPGRVAVCAITGDTTAQEVYEVDACLKARQVHSVMLLVDSYHTRRSLAMFSHLLPHYRWSIAAVPVPERFATDWWRKRVWIRTAVVEWQHLLWWECIDRWRFTPVSGRS